MEVALAVELDSPAWEHATRWDLPVVARFSPGAAAQAALLGALRRRVQAGVVDVLHVHTGVGHLTAELARWGREDVALVRTRGDIRPPRGTPWNRRLHRSVDAAVSSSRVLLSGWDRVRVPVHRRHVVPLGIDLDRFSPHTLPDRDLARRELGLPTEALVVGIVARLSPVKGHDVLLRAVAGLDPDGPPVEVLVAGEPAQLTSKELRTRAVELGVGDRVTFVGRVDDVRGLLAAIDVGVVASLGSEAICRVGGEMMAVGVPLVASAVSVLPEMVGEGGCLVPPGDVGALTDALDRLRRDPVERDRLTRHGLERAQALSLDVMADAYDEVYARARAERRAGSR
jgi:glycosyltransferase involved in cell wall biosynthesis